MGVEHINNRESGLSVRNKLNALIDSDKGKQDKETGKGLSTNDYTTAEKDKLAALSTQEQINSALANKQDKLTAGNNINIIDGVISATSTIETSEKITSYRKENVNGKIEYVSKAGIILQEIYTRLIQINSLPIVTTSGSNSVTSLISEENLGNNVYLIIDSINIAPSQSRYITTNYADNYKVEIINGADNLQYLKITCLTVPDAMSINAYVKVSYVKYFGKKATVEIDCTTEASAEALALSIPTLKFNKDILFSVTLDDSNTSAYCVAHQAINNKEISAGEQGFMHANQYLAGDLPNTHSSNIGYPLTFTDGCGKDRRFAIDCAVWPNCKNTNGVNMMDTSNPVDKTANNQYRFMSPYLQWVDIKEMIKFGSSFSQHNVNENVWDKNVATSVLQGFAEDNVIAVARTGRGMKICTQPDGNDTYTDAFMLDDSKMLDFSAKYSTYIAKSNSELYKLKVYRAFPDPVTDYETTMQTEIAKAEETRIWLHIGQHRVTSVFVDFIEWVYEKYGKKGADNIWFATPDEIYEYFYMRNNTQIVKTINGTKATFTLYIPSGQYFYYPELSLCTNNTNISTVTVSDNIIGLSVNTAKSMININLNEALSSLAEEMTTRYETSTAKTDKEDADYFVEQLKDGTIKSALQARIAAVVQPIAVTGIAITNKPINITDSVQLGITYTPTNTAQQSVAWASSNEAVATVSSTGLVTVIANGNVTITATSTTNSALTDSFTATCEKTATGITISGIAITSKPSTIKDSVKLDITYTPTNTTQQGVTWSSSDETIATIDSSGSVTVLKAGSVTITATSTTNSALTDSFTATCEKTATGITISGIAITGNSLVNTGGTVQLSVTYTPSNTTQTGINWTSSNESIATVNSTGLVTAIAVGNVVITATSTDNNSITATKSIEITAVASNVVVKFGKFVANTQSILYNNEYYNTPNYNQEIGASGYITTIVNSATNAIISDWNKMGKTALMEKAGISTWVNITGSDANNPTVFADTPFSTYSYLYQYNQALTSYWGIYVPNGTYKISFLISSSRTDADISALGSITVNGSLVTLPAIAITNNTQWTTELQFSVTDGCIFIMLHTNTNKTLGWNSIRIEKLA